MVFLRITAAVFVLLLIGCFAFVGVGSVALIGQITTHSTKIEHDAGTIKSIGPGMSFTLKTANHTLITFQCVDRCLTALNHMRRHELEKAHTDVFYVQKANNIFLALDVD